MKSGPGAELSRRRLILSAGAINWFPLAARTHAMAQHAGTEPKGPFETIDALGASLAASGVGASDQRFLLALARPALALRSAAAADGDIAVGASKIGGAPDLPRGMAWPMRPPTATGRAEVATLRKLNKKTPSAYLADQIARKAPLANRPAPLTFMLQLDLAACASAGALDPDIPRTGHFLVFYDLVFKPWSGQDADGTPMFRLLHVPKDAELARRRAPDLGFPLFGDLDAYRDCLPPARLAPQFTYTLPDPSSLPLLTLYPGRRGVPHADWLETAPTHLDASNRVGGWPENIQNDMTIGLAAEAAGIELPTGDGYLQAVRRIEPLTRDWVFLLQIGDYDNTVNDFDGLYYVWIRRADLRAGDFGKARMIFQTS